MEFFEVRSQINELSKSGHCTMMGFNVSLNWRKKKHYYVFTYDNACRLLLPYKSILEANNRIINDGTQESIGSGKQESSQLGRALASALLDGAKSTWYP
jgi:hypothetical protein